MGRHGAGRRRFCLQCSRQFCSAVLELAARELLSRSRGSCIFACHENLGWLVPAGTTCDWARGLDDVFLSDATRTSARFSLNLSTAASIPAGSRCGGRSEVQFAESGVSHVGSVVVRRTAGAGYGYPQQCECTNTARSETARGLDHVSSSSRPRAARRSRRGPPPVAAVGTFMSGSSTNWPTTPASASVAGRCTCAGMAPEVFDLYLPLV